MRLCTDTQNLFHMLQGTNKLSNILPGLRTPALDFESSKDQVHSYFQMHMSP